MTSFSGSRLRVGEAYSAAAGLIRRNLVLCGVTVLALFVVQTAWNLGVQQESSVKSIKSILIGLSVLPIIEVIHYSLITRLMQAEGMTDRGWSLGTLVAFLVADLLNMFGTAFGMVLLIVPGVIVALRWSIYANFVIGRDLGPIAAIKASWEATRGSAGTIFAIFFIFALIILGGFFLMHGFGVQAAIWTPRLIAATFWNELFVTIQLCVTTSIYMLLTGPDHTRLQEVFA